MSVLLANGLKKAIKIKLKISLTIIKRIALICPMYLLHIYLYPSYDRS